jgi:aldose 1-epimerase
MREIVLSAGDLRLVVRPEWGGRVAAFRHARAGDILIPIEAVEFDPEAWPKAGAYPLAPFHNRIRDARFRLRRPRGPPRPAPEHRAACAPRHGEPAAVDRRRGKRRLGDAHAPPGGRRGLALDI